MLIPDLLDSFKRYFLYECGNTAQSCKRIQASLKRFCEFVSTDKVASLTASNIRAFLFEMNEKRAWTPKTFRNVCQRFSSFCQWCVSHGYLAENPIRSIKKPKLPPRLPRFIQRSDIDLTLSRLHIMQWGSVLQKYRNEAIFKTFLYSGIRLNELLHLHVGDVNLEEMKIYIRYGKGGKDRFVKIHPALLPALMRYQNERKEQLPPSLYYFTGVRSDKRLQANDICRIFKRISQVSGVHVTAHKLRHTFAHLCLNCNLSIRKLQELLGHSDLRSTLRYSSVSDESVSESFIALRFPQ